MYIEYCLIFVCCITLFYHGQTRYILQYFILYTRDTSYENTIQILNKRRRSIYEIKLSQFLYYYSRNSREQHIGDLLMRASYLYEPSSEYPI